MRAQIVRALASSRRPSTPTRLTTQLTTPCKWHEIMGPIMGGWMGEAVDGRGHHDGMCEYFVEVPIEDFGHKFFAGGEARWIQHYPEKTYRLPAVRPAAGGLGNLRESSENLRESSGRRRCDRRRAVSLNSACPCIRRALAAASASSLASRSAPPSSRFMTL